jgi:hypothetical protein
MIRSIQLLAGLPAYGPLATAYPERFARTGREGTVVEIESDTDTWIGNFQPGLGDTEMAANHPNGRDGIVIAGGDLWVVHGESRSAECVASAIFAAIPVDDPKGWVFDRQGLALLRFGAAGVIWHTRRLSWDGFEDLRIEGDKIKGRSWALGDSWLPFEVDVATGRSSGGGYSMKDDLDWEQLAN